MPFFIFFIFVPFFIFSEAEGPTENVKKKKCQTFFKHFLVGPKAPLPH